MELRIRMLKRIQLKWRQSAYRRTAQEYKQTNSFRIDTCTSVVLDRTLSMATRFYDLTDELQGVHVQEWLRRLEVNAKYGGLFQNSRWIAFIDAMNVLERLRELGPVACHAKFERLGICSSKDIFYETP